MTYLEILGWARKGVIAEKENYRQMQEKALEGQAHDLAPFDLALLRGSALAPCHQLSPNFWAKR